MNDNANSDTWESDWVYALLEKHDLHLRADTPTGAVYVLISDAAADLEAAAQCILKDRTVTAASLAKVKRLIAMLEDATKVATFCEPV